MKVTDSEFLTTREFSAIVRTKPAHIRRVVERDGEYLGVRPVKLPNQRLLWPAQHVRALLTPQPREAVAAA
ncbi:DNA-binding protein [Burkholderia sp. RF2-non_BP3]|uniref:DNA-binding protein n=1 Tax=Burkholderia sp. RF2-non_BP3 TaxID=1637844 RepID=UPI000AB18700|nr:DNA-binding protein [Burkholderia sp. RF2-non_BP3]